MRFYYILNPLVYNPKTDFYYFFSYQTYVLVVKETSHGDVSFSHSEHMFL